MRVRFILPALAEAERGLFRPIKYALFPPLGLATLAGYLEPDDEIELYDQHVEPVPEDGEPDLVAIEVYITSAHRAYAMADRYRARGIFVVMGGLHPTSLPEEALRHADTVVLGPAHAAWPEFLRDFRRRNTRKIYADQIRTLETVPPVRRDLIKRRNYLLRERAAVLHRAGRPGAGGDRVAAGASLVLSRRQPLRFGTFCPRTLRGDARHAAALSGGGDGPLAAK